MNIERKLLLLLVLRVRSARQNLDVHPNYRISSSQEVEWFRGKQIGRLVEARNSYQLAKRIYNESLKDE